MVIGNSRPECLEAALHESPTVLAVFPDETGLEQLKDYWHGAWPERLQIAQQLIGANACEQIWFHYNDQRCNGLIGPEAWAHRYPNLKLDRRESRHQISLVDALNQWEPAERSDGGLVLIGAWAEELLRGCGTSLQRLQNVLWLTDPGDVSADIILELESSLRLSWLVLDATSDQSAGCVVWKRDPDLQFKSTVLAERDELLAEREAMKQRFESINRELDTILGLME